MESLTCVRCGNGWTPRKSGRPVRCPACGSRAWNSPRESDGGESANDHAGSGSGDTNPSRRIVLDETQSERVCEKCGHEWVGPKYKHCPACDRPRWWEPRQLTKADQKTASRHADAESRRADQQRRDEESKRKREQQQQRDAAEYRLHTAAGDVQNASIWGGPQWIPWAQVFDRAWQAYEDAAETARSGAEHERRLDRERAEREHESRRKWEAEAKGAKEQREREIEKQKRHEHVLRSRAAQARAREAWLDEVWHRRPCAALAKAASTSVDCILDKLLAAIFIVALGVAVILILEFVAKPMVVSDDGIIEKFRPDEVAPSLALTPTPIPQNIAQTEEYWLERRQGLQEGFDFWADAITARTVSGKKLPNNVTLEYARDSLEYFRTELHAANLRLAGFSNGNN